MDYCYDEPEFSDHWDDDWDEEFGGLAINRQGSNTEDSDESNQHKEKSTQRLRRRRRKRRIYFYIPRLFKRDIRRFYATMLANVSNAHDYNLFYSFFRTYATSDIVVKRHRVDALPSLRTAITNSSSCPAMTPHYTGSSGGLHEIRGILSFANALYCSTQMNPDQIVSVHNVQVTTRPQSDISRVTFDMDVQFTHLYDLPPVVFMDNVLTVVNEYLTTLTGNEEETHRPITIDGGGMATLSTPHLLTPTSAEAAAMRPIVEPFQLCQLVCGRPIHRCARPISILVRITTILHLDERRRITAIETTNISYLQ